jgi:hypothetical protein
MSKTIVATLELRDEDEDDIDEDEDDSSSTKSRTKQRERDEQQANDTSGYFIVIEQQERKLQEEFGEISLDPFIVLHCYPGDVELQALHGELKIGEERVKTVVEVIRFNGSDGARLKYPNAYEVNLTPVGNVMEEVYEKDKDGNEELVEYRQTSVSYYFRSSNNSAMVSGGSKVHGVCLAKYKATYVTARYSPEPLKLVEYNPKGEPKESLFGGIIFATLEEDGFVRGLAHDVTVDPPPKPIEYARVYSKIVLDSFGPHEAPEGWPDNTAIDPYIFKENQAELDPDNSFTDERTHLIITIDAFGNLHYEFFGHNYLDPFVDRGLIQYMDTLIASISESWAVQFYARFSEAPGGKLAKSPESFYFDMHNLTWRDVFNWIDQAKIFEQLKSKHYANLIDEKEKDE